jgi:outer membrane immunogenic protein
MMTTKLRICAALLAISAGVTEPASAADLGDHASLKDVPVAAPFNWTGFYLGAGGGGSISTYSGGVNGFIFIDATTIPFGSVIEEDKAGIFGTVQVGYDRQINNRFVFGFFADYDWNRQTGADFNAPFAFEGVDDDIITFNFNGTVEVEDSWTIGARFGFMVTPNTLIYGLAGWTHSEVNLSGLLLISSDAITLPVPFAAEENMESLTLGTGVETLLRKDLSLKVEYRYTDLGGLSASPAFFGPAGTGIDFDSDIHSVRAVLSWRP